MKQISTDGVAKNPSGGRIDWHVEPAWHEALLVDGDLPLARWIRDGTAQIVKDGPHRTVYRVDLPAHSVYVKHYRCRRWLRVLRHLFRASASRREWRGTSAVARRGVATVEPVALGEERRGGLVADSFFVTAALPATQPLDRYLDAALPRLPPPARAAARRNLVLALARFTAAAHRAGVDHDDFHTGNLLVQTAAVSTNPRGDDLPRLFLIDLPGVRLGRPLDWRRTRAALASLDATLLRRSSLRERWRFWREYLRQRPELELADPRRAALDVARRGREHLRRVLRRRDDRALRATRNVVCLRSAAGRAWGVADLAEDVLPSLLDDPARLLRDGRHAPLKIAHGSVVVQAALPTVHGPQAVACKRWREATWWKRLASRLRRSRALSAWRLGHALLNRGIATARPLAAIEPAGRSGESYLATEWIADAEDLHLYLWRIAALPAAERMRRTRQAADALGALVGRLHAWRIAHRDLKACNLVVACRGAEIAAWLIDLDGVRIRRRISESERSRNLARLATSMELHPWLTRADRRRFLRAYLRQLGDRAIDPKFLWREVAPRSRALTARMRRRGGVA